MPLNRPVRYKSKRSKLPRKANSWLANCKGPAGNIIRKTDSLLSLHAQLAKILPEPLISHVQVIAIDDARLVLAADSAVWASQLRHRRNAILRQMTPSSHNSLQQLEIKVSSLYAPPLIRKINRHLPTHAGHNLELAARAIDDPELSAALRRLARHSSNKSGNDPL